MASFTTQTNVYNEIMNFSSRTRIEGQKNFV
ncbi:MAG: hypothetical protein JWQ04_338, partial [Pedosphaera sp.]|nr:hypothetical protein [Pedosphaera sp.]